MKKTIFSLTLLFLPIILMAQQNEHDTLSVASKWDYVQANWNESRETIMNRIQKTNESPLDDFYVYSSTEVLEGTTCKIVYFFEEDKLIEGLFDFIEYDLEAALDLFVELENKIKSITGEQGTFRTTSRATQVQMDTMSDKEMFLSGLKNFKHEWMDLKNKRYIVLDLSVDSDGYVSFSVQCMPTWVYHRYLFG